MLALENIKENVVKKIKRLLDYNILIRKHKTAEIKFTLFVMNVLVCREARHPSSPRWGTTESGGGTTTTTLSIPLARDRDGGSTGVNTDSSEGLPSP